MIYRQVMMGNGNMVVLVVGETIPIGQSFVVVVVVEVVVVDSLFKK